MENTVAECIIIIGNDNYPFQEFNGKRYHLYKGEKYFSRGTKRLHVVVYEHYFGKVNKGYHVHHKDENTHDNYPANLEQLKGSEHMSKHMQKRDKAALIERINYARIFASEWHGSPEGIEWHKKVFDASLGKALIKNIPCKCEQCGKEYLNSKSNLSTGKYCSNTCKSKARYLSGVDNESRNCIVCGTNFGINRYTKTKTCSKDCANKIGWINRKATSANI